MRIRCLPDQLISSPRARDIDDDADSAPSDDEKAEDEMKRMEDRLSIGVRSSAQVQILRRGAPLAGGRATGGALARSAIRRAPPRTGPR
jgi:hypothetical protein